MPSQHILSRKYRLQFLLSNGCREQNVETVRSAVAILRTDTSSWRTDAKTVRTVLTSVRTDVAILRTDAFRFRTDLESEGHKFISLGLLCATLVKQSYLFIYLFIYLLRKPFERLVEHFERIFLGVRTDNERITNG